jgi:hypothetical protein
MVWTNRQHAAEQRSQLQLLPRPLLHALLRGIATSAIAEPELLLIAVMAMLRHAAPTCCPKCDRRVLS